MRDNGCHTDTMAGDSLGMTRYSYFPRTNRVHYLNMLCVCVYGCVCLCMHLLSFMCVYVYVRVWRMCVRVYVWVCLALMSPAEMGLEKSCQQAQEGGLSYRGVWRLACSNLHPANIDTVDHRSLMGGARDARKHMRAHAQRARRHTHTYTQIYT